MLTYPNRRTTNIAPVDFDYKALGQATNLLLGKSKADTLLKDTSPKGILNLIGELENEAREIRKDPKREFPKDNTFRRSKKELENLRDQMVREIFNWRSLWSKQSLKTALPYRIRSVSQLDALSSNKIEQIGKEGENGPEITARVSLDSLPSLVKEAEQSGYAKLSFPVNGEDIDFVKTKLKQGNISLTFRDELPERPELKRIVLGNQNYKAQRLAREKKSNPRTELLNIANTFTGSIVVLSNNSRVTNVTEKQTTRGIELEVELMFPEILSAFEKNGRDNGGEGVLTDGKLKNHCSNAYGCNGRDFLSSVPEISSSLKTNLEDAAKLWFDVTEVEADTVKNFLDEYSILSLSLRHEPTPLGKLEPARSLVKSTRDITLGGSTGGSFETGAETSFSKEILEDARINMPTTGSSLAGADWLNNLVNKEVYQTYKTPRGQTYSEELDNTYKIKDPSRKMELIERNFWRSPSDNFQLLDGGPTNIELASYYLSNEMEEEYELEKEENEQELFNSKAEYIIDPKEKVKKQSLDKAEWIQRRKHIVLSLPYSGNILHRLTKYPNRNSGLSVKTTRAEKFDPEVSLAMKEFRRTPTKPDGKNLTIEDCLNKEGLTNLAQLKTTGQDYQIEELKRISSLLEQWQSSLRKLSITSKNPLEHKVLRWLEAVAQNKEECKASSLLELSTMLGTSVSQAGRIPYENERGVEHFSMPARSNPLPLKLLCGGGFEELSGLEMAEKRETKVLKEDSIANDPARLWDTVIRWQNAENLHEMELETKAPKFLIELEEAINSENFNTIDLITHAIKVELSQLPDFKSDYLERIGLKNGLMSIPKEFKPFGDLFYPLDSSPETTTIKGEETPIDDVLKELESEGISIKLSPEEERKVQNAPEEALGQWRASIISIVENLNKIDAPTNKDTEIELILSSTSAADATEELDTANTQELDPFMESIALLHQEIPQSEEDLKDVLRNLITNNPQNVKIHTPEKSFELSKGSSNQWTSKDKSPQAQRAIELFDQAQNLIDDNNSKDINNTDQEIDPTYLEMKNEARKTRLFENIEQLPKVLSSLPPELKNSPRIKELCQPLEILSNQVQSAKKASELGESLIKGWMGTLEEKENPWGWDQALLNPVGSVEYLCDKITGKPDPEAKSKHPSEEKETSDHNKAENKASYFTHTLIKDGEKIEAIERLKTNGSVVAGNFLIESLNNNLLAIKAQASQSLPELMEDLENQLKDLISKSHTKEVKDFICGDSPIKRLLEDKTRYRLLESKLRETAKDLSETKGTVRTVFKDNQEPEEITHQQVGKDVIPGTGYKVSTSFEISPTGTAITTNKIWATRWLNSNLGKQNLEERINLNKWVKDVCQNTVCNPKTAIAFVEFCKHRNLLNIPQAISSGKLKDEEKKAIETALRSFRESLNNISVDPQKTEFKTQLIAAYALNQYVQNTNDSKLWNRELEKDLETISHTINSKDMTLNASFSNDKVSSKNSVTSPFRKKRELVSGIDLEADIENADPKTKLRTVFKAVAVLYKSIPTEKRQGKPKKSMTNPIQKSKPKTMKEQNELVIN